MQGTPPHGSGTPLLKKACVIQAVGGDGSEVRQRADRVLQSIIEPACQATGYEAVRVDAMDTRTIAEPIISALNTYPLAIADLAAPPWDPNVLMEVGFRLAYGRPIVLLADTDPKPDLLPLQLRSVRIHTIDPANPGAEDVESLIQSIKRYGSEVNYWESDYPTIEFSLSLRSPDGGRFIFANDKAARLYGLVDSNGLPHPEEMIGRPVNEVDPRLKDFIPDEEYYREYQKDQDAILGKVVKRDREPKAASIPLWFTNHAVVDENDKIYWPVLVQYRYVSDEEHADIVMRVIFINVSEWDAMKPRPRKPPQVLRVPRLFREVRQPAPPEYDVFLSYNSRDHGYVNELQRMLVRCGVKVWFDQTDFGGGSGLTTELIRAMNLSRIFALVLGRNGLGPWQGDIEARSQFLRIVKGQKLFVLLLLPEVEPGDTAWRNYLGKPELETVLEDRLRLPLPDVQELAGVLVLSPDRKLPFAERLLQFVIQLLRSLDARQS